jgi:hypothetical protein
MIVVGHLGLVRKMLVEIRLLLLLIVKVLLLLLLLLLKLILRHQVLPNFRGL